MHEVEIDEELPEGEDQPSYDTPGRILVHYHGPSGVSVRRYECEVLDHDADSSVYWISVGVDFDYWLDEHAEFTEPGHYVIEGITGEYIKGEWGYTDDDEEWSFTSMRSATDAEISSGTLSQMDR
jgi:hypothetical protein